MSCLKAISSLNQQLYQMPFSLIGIRAMKNIFLHQIWHQTDAVFELNMGDDETSDQMINFNFSSTTRDYLMVFTSLANACF